MLPYVRIFGKPLPMYSIATLFGVALAVLYLKIRERSEKGLQADLELAFLYAWVGAAAGAKLLYLMICGRGFLSELPYLFTAPNAFLEKYLYSGFVFYGGLFGALSAVWLYCRFCCLELCRFTRVLLPLFPLIHSFGRVGCFCAGCCYGIPASAFFGVTFHHSPFAPNGEPLVPVQLMEAAAELVIFVILARKSALGKSGASMTGGYLAAYGILRFWLEFLRGDKYRGFIGAWSIAQYLSVICAATGFYILCRGKKRSPVV